MAYTSAPETQTYSSQRISLCHTIENTTTFGTNIGSYTDAGMVNLIPIVQGSGEDKAEVPLTRPGLYGVSVTNTANMDARGVYVWDKTSSLTYYYACCGNQIFTSTDGTTWTSVVTWTNSLTSPIGFTEFIDSTTNTKKLIVVDGREGYIFTDNTAGTKITDADFPSPHLPFPVFLDGYLFLAKADTGDIYNSDLNDPASWTAGNFISSELYPDDVQAIVKINN